MSASPDRFIRAPILSWSMMRCIFAFQICLVHVCAKVWVLDDDSWLAATTFMAIARSGTIGFMLLSGAILVAQSPTSAGAYVMHRVRRWLPPLLLAQALYLALDFYLGHRAGLPFTFGDALVPAWPHLWFFYALGLIYVVVIPMRHYAAWANTRAPIIRQCALWAPVLALFLLQAVQTVKGGFWGDLQPVNLAIYCGYAWAGYVVHTTFPRGSVLGIVPAVIGVVLAVWFTDLASHAAARPISHYFHRCSFFSAMAGAGQFLFLLHLARAHWTAETEQKFHRLARLTLGTYVIHPLVLVLIFWPIWWDELPPIDWFGLPVVALGVFLVSAALVAAFFRMTPMVAPVAMRRWAGV